MGGGKDKKVGTGVSRINLKGGRKVNGSGARERRPLLTAFFLELDEQDISTKKNGIRSEKKKRIY